MTEDEIAEKLLESAEVIENNGKNVIGYKYKLNNLIDVYHLRIDELKIKLILTNNN